MLRFSPANTKLKKLQKKIGKKVYSLDLLSGHNCPFADKCLAMAVELPNGKRKIKDGPNNRFRCYSASQEARLPNVYKLRKENSDTLLAIKNNTSKMAELISKTIPKNTEVIRIHSSGDFFSQKYFDAWVKIALRNPQITFYAYTKSLRFWINRLDFIPSNLVLTASYDGLDDHLIKEYNLRSSLVVFSEKEAENLGMDIDYDDSLAYNKAYKKSFCLLIHTTQPPGTDAAKAWQKIKDEKILE